MNLTGTHHVALLTNNFDGLREFYADTLGLPVVGGFPGGNIIFLEAGSTTIELIRREGFASQLGGWGHFAFEVADVDQEYAALVEKGVSFHILPKSVPEGDSPSARIAFFRDPDGNELELFQPLGGKYPQP
jgi:catechol 2,3-dioxygenase-like lactoylglutathione lyase family enzyme